MKAKGTLREFRVIGRKLPTENEPETPLYRWEIHFAEIFFDEIILNCFFRMRIFAPDAIVAKSRFWYFLRQLRKFKKTTGEIVSVEEIKERKPLEVKNFGIWLRYDSRSGTHNMYREYRDLTVSAAITQCYRSVSQNYFITSLNDVSSYLTFVMMTNSSPTLSEGEKYFSLSLKKYLLIIKNYFTCVLLKIIWQGHGSQTQSQSSLHPDHQMRACGCQGHSSSSGQADARLQHQVPSPMQGPEAGRWHPQGQQTPNILPVINLSPPLEYIVCSPCLSTWNKHLHN